MILKEAMMADAFSLPLESLPDWLEIENVDRDDLVLSQVLQEVEEDMSLANASETIEENIRLSQIHPNMEPFYNMSVSQAVDYYHLGTFELGDFLLTDFKDEDVEPVRFTAPVLDEDVEPVRFTAPVSDEDIEKLISSQTKRIQSGQLVFLMNGESQDLNMAIVLLTYTCLKLRNEPLATTFRD
ncbi:unnamed protein product [Mytilus edulis]|uniref:Uncharacterized protein n=1 Tax=Mytilus edulis TaxID=6550 RepID=A0A8S3PZK1_MYTED|nr:unnamed protein product [Mytilus edulis]